MKGRLAIASWTLLATGAIAGAAAARAEEAGGTVAAAETKDGAGAKAGEKKAPAGLGQRNEREVTLAEQLSFREEQVHGEMEELEQRMFRLSETLKKLEPENSSRLMLGLKYAREELILHQMKQTQDALAKLSLQGAIDEQKQLLAKLERLQQLLLSSDLDFEMRLERLRQIRDTLKKLDTVIKEESREERQSRKAAERENQLAALAKRREALQGLIQRQTEHLEQNTPLAAKSDLADEDRQALTGLKQAQETTREGAQQLQGKAAAESSESHLAAASEAMKGAVDELAKPAAAAAQPAMEKALAELQKELADVAEREEQAKEALNKEQLTALKKDQEANRAATDDVTEMTRQLGSSGTGAIGELLKAGGSMSSAEGAFGGGQAGQGNGEQVKAVASLRYAAEMLAEEAERLARQLRGEVKKRVMEGLTVMLEMQVAVRQRTVALTAGVKDGSRQALAAVTALAKREEKITATAQDLINVVEETEFGIALPAALAAVRDATEGVQMSLADGDASDAVVSAEKQIEADLKAMLEVVGEMSDANSKKGRRGGESEEDMRKEQNRIISELKMIRLLQTRVKQSTVEVDGKRETAALSPSMRKRIEDIEGRQEDIRDATEQLAEERGDEVPQQ